MQKHAEICGIPLHSAPKEFFLDAIEQQITQKSNGHYISITNTESMYHAKRKPENFDYIRSADFSFCDGIGVVVVGWFWGHKITRYTGPTFELDCVDYGQSRGWRHFFYGGREGVADKMVEKLKEQFPGMISAGTYCPPFRELTPEEDEAVVNMINDARPDIVWVGLGLPKQEMWIARHRHRVQAPWMCGVGAAFDFHSGTIPRSPRWMSTLGLEWVFRLSLQPQLKAKRYWWSLLFSIEAAWAGIKQKAFHRS